MNTPKTTRKPRTVAAAPKTPPSEYYRFLDEPRLDQIVHRAVVGKAFLTDAEAQTVAKLTARAVACVHAASSPAAGVDAFLAEAGTWHERVDRWSTLLIARCITHPGQTPPVKLPWVCGPCPDSQLKGRPLRPLELHAVILTGQCFGQLYGPSVVLAALGADPGEFARILPDHFTAAPESGEPTVAFPGDAKHAQRGPTAVAARAAEIPGWAQRAVESLLERASMLPTTPVLYRGGDADEQGVASTVNMRLNKVLKHTGHHWDPTVKPISIRNGTLRRAHETGGIQAAWDLSGFATLTPLQKALALTSTVMDHPA